MFDDKDKTMMPRKPHAAGKSGKDTMPGWRDRNKDGRFRGGDLIMERYKVLSELGQGGMGVVYRCLDETGGDEVALKALPPELSHNTLEMEDIRNNYLLVSKLVHQNIAVIKHLEKDLATGNYYLIMECCKGEDLRRWIKRKRQEGTLTLEAVLPIIQQVAAALDYAHSEKIIHRDIKPGNIMIDQSGKIKVLDFGLAAQIHTSMTRVSMAYHGTSGTGPYMAPEQWRGRQQDAHADQYALAVMTYEMLAGHLPFESSDPAVLQQAVLTQTAEAIPDIPDFAMAAIYRAMSKEPAERFATCSEFAAALSKPQVKAVSFRKRGVLPALMGTILGAALIIGGAIIIAGKDSSSNSSNNSSNSSSSSSSSVADSQSRAADSEKDPVKTFTLPNNVKLEMVLVEPGSFTMSKKDGENARDEIEHPKTLTKPFYIGKYEVTQAQYQAVMGKNPSKFKGDNRPVECVSWHEAMEFCEKMNKYAPTGWQFTLPTETQWEFAARGGNKSRDYKYSGSDTPGDVAWYKDNSGDTTHVVGGKAPNELGLYDMSGNVWEWCLDNFQNDSSNTKAEFTRAYRDSDGSDRVIRGGGLVLDARHCRSANRNYTSPANRYSSLGLRLALVPAE